MKDVDDSLYDNLRTNALNIIKDNAPFWYNIFILKTPYLFSDSVNICDLIYIFKDKDVKTNITEKYQDLLVTLTNSTKSDKIN